MTAEPLQYDVAVDDFVDRVETANLVSVQQLLLFGSVARGTHTSDSDVDVLAVVDDTADVPTVEERLRDIAYDVMLDHGPAFSIHAVMEGTLDDRSTHPFFRTVLAEGQPIYG